MQPCFHVINPLCHHISRPQIELRAKMAIIGRALLVPEDMDDRQHSAMGSGLKWQHCFRLITSLLYHSSRPQIKLRAKMAINRRALLDTEDMDGRHHSAMGVLAHPLHNSIRLEKLWVATDSLAFTSSTHFSTIAQGLRSS